MRKTAFDVFLCHNSLDKKVVRSIGRRLRERGVSVWFDQWNLRPGFPWQAVLEEQIDCIKSAAVFVGESGIGPWQDHEIAAFLREFVKRGCPVIPVLLPSATTPTLPVFLRAMTWVDMNDKERDAVDLLIWGITGRNPAEQEIKIG